jgi:tetratricopeptide (TPR) repeat protein
MDMSSVLKASLIFIVICLAASTASPTALGTALGQQPGRGKPAAKPGEPGKVEAKDLLKQAAALFEAGQNAHQRGELEKAIEHYNEALKLDSSLWQAEFQMSVACLSLNRFAEARRAISHVLEQLKEFADSTESRQMAARAQVVLGEVALAEAKPAEAETAFRRAIELNPRAGRAQAGLAEVLLKNSKHAEAASAAKAALAAGDERSSTLSLLGEALGQARQYEEALAVFAEMLKREPRSAAALRYRAEISNALGQVSDAINDLRSALTLEPNAQARLRLAELYLRAKQPSEALALYQQILRDEPENSEARRALAALMIESGKAGEAIAELEALIKAKPNRADLRAQLAELYLPAQPEKALEQYAAAAKLEPQKLNHQIGVGSALVKLRRYQEAIAALRQALAHNPQAELAYFAHTNLATALFELDDYPNAAREFLWILNQQKDQRRAAVALYFLGICFDKLGDYEQALKAYEQFLALASPANQLEIDKVKLRLPSLKRQIEKGQGIKRKQ